MAAARFMLQRRLGSALGLDRTRFIQPFFSSGIKLFNTNANPTSPQTELKADSNSTDSNSNPPQNNSQNPNTLNPLENQSKVSYNIASNLKSSARHDMAMIFTCKVCETRSVKTACRESYETGVVIARCPGCNNLHLIADRLGWFGQPGSVEDFLAQKGEEFKKGSVDTVNFTLEDLAGTDKS
ncbi:hypothetical protein LUZ60_006892 [Juncus effusus]|nr:hypothetical protein LUZ60_006892 [Juncus effusus]